MLNFWSYLPLNKQKITNNIKLEIFLYRSTYKYSFRYSLPFLRKDIDKNDVSMPPWKTFLFQSTLWGYQLKNERNVIRNDNFTHNP